MAFKISNKSFDEVFNKQNDNIKTLEDSNEFLKKFLHRLKRYLKKNERYPVAKSMGVWLEKGGSLSSFTCREDLVPDMIDAFRREGIPFIIIQETTGKRGFLIRNKDEDKQHKIARKVLKTAALYCKVVSGKEAKEAYLRKRIPDRKMIAIGDLTKNQVVYLEALCDKVLPDECVGVDKMEDGTYLFTVHGQTAIGGTQKAHGRRFTAALAETIVLFNGNSRRELGLSSENVIEFRKAKVNGFLDKDGDTQKPVWIVGSSNIFIKRNRRGFEVGHANEIADEVIFETDYRVAFDDELYDKKMNSALFNIPNRKVLYTLPEVIEHFKTTKKAVAQNLKVQGEQHLIEFADYAVSQKIMQDTVFVRGNDWVTKMKHYQSEMAKVLKGVKEAKVPQGYHRDQIIELMDIAHKYKLNLDIMTPAISKLQNIEVYDRSTQVKVRDIVAEIAKHSHALSQEQVQNRPEQRRDMGRE